jgi:glucan phosphoethanolaminetransferase (alkaline phosphatase superfamily)
MGGISEKLITLSYVVISSGLILSPFFIIRKFKIVKWKHIILSYILSMGIFVGLEFLDNWFDKYLYNNVYNSGWIMEVLLNASMLQWFVLSIIFIISPFLITKIKYKRFSKKRIIISIFLSLLIGIGLFFGWIYLIGWGLGQIGQRYF